MIEYNLKYRNKVKKLNDKVRKAEKIVRRRDKELAKVNKLVMKLEDKLFKYGKCKKHCTSNGSTGKCNCGWQELMLKLAPGRIRL